MDLLQDKEMINKGILTISIDVELAWGIYDKPITPKHRLAIQQERKAIGEIIALFNKYKINATWAVVGHLLSDECKGRDGIWHPEFERPIIPSKIHDWFFQHPEEGMDPIWYGRDILEKIKNASPPQEIASHSFCHIPYNEDKTSPQAVITDIEEAKHIHQIYNLPFKVFIFPRNIVGFKKLLARKGIVVYRGKTKRWYDSIPVASFRRLMNLVYFILSINPPAVEVTVDDTDMVNVPDSMLLIGRNGIRRLIPVENLIKMGIAGLNRAAATGRIFHLWFHPQNFIVDMKGQLYILENILKHAQNLRNRERLQILTLEEIGKSFPGSETISEDILGIRQKAITKHDKEAGLFDRKYSLFKKDPYVSAFAYSRSKIEALLRKYLQVLPLGSEVLDIGCGTGEQLKICSQFGLKVVGIEPAIQMRLIAQRNNIGVAISDGSIADLPFPDKTFDFVFAIEVLRYLHSSDVKKAYREMLRVTKPGGKIFFSMVNRYALDGFILYYFLKKITRQILNFGNVAHCEFVTPEKIKKDLSSLNIENIDCYGLLFAPVRFLYKINSTLAAKVVKIFDKYFDALAEKKNMLRFAGHLIVIVERTKNR